MKLPPLITSLLALVLAFAGVKFSNASDPSAYEQATAGNPGFENKELWPKLSGKERFLAQEHPPARVMEWARPGESLGGRGSLDAWDPENWLLNGEPADVVKFDENTDLVLPPSDTPYTLDLKRVEGWEPVYRHITIGENATLLHESSRTFGNVWVKKGGVINARHGNNYLGGHTFIRNDDGSYEDAKDGRIGQYFMLRKEDPEASLEIIGYVSMLDRVPVESGTLIIGPDARFSPGRNASMIISEGATVALLDGSRLVKWVNQIGQVDLIVFGTLQGGLPERPLTRPAYLDLSYQNTTGVPFFDKLPQPAESVKTLEERVASMIVGKKGVIQSFSGAPEGMLNVRWSGIDAADWHMGSHGVEGDWLKSLNEEQTAYLKQQLEAIPKKLAVIFQEGARIDGLVVNDFHAGGFLMENPADADSWKNLSYGEGNDATEEKLISEISRATVLDSVKNPGGGYTIGAPEFFASNEFTGDEWTEFQFTATVPPEAAGKNIGLRFSPRVNGWCHIDDVVMKVDGEDLIVNGGFEEPADLPEFKKKIELTRIPAWNNMSDMVGEVGVAKLDGRRIGAIYHSDTSMGQTLEYVARGGETVEVIFQGRLRDANLEVELFSISAE